MHSVLSKRFRTTLLGLGFAALAAVSALPTAQAEPARTLTAGEQRVLDQQPLVRAAEVLRARLAEAAGGYAGIVLESSDVVLWWKGASTPAVGEAVRAASAFAPVRVAPAAYTEAELDAAADRVNRWLQENPDSGAYGVKSPGDGSGLVLAAKPGVMTTFSALNEVADVPLRVLHEEPLAPVSRGDDAPPWKGGARTWNQTAGTICTAGFGVRNGAGNQFVLTAEHCGQNGHRITDGVGEFIGNVGQGHNDHDIALIPTSQASNRMYVGGGSSNTTEQVLGWTHVFVGQLLCQSGVTSAEQTGNPVCDLKVLFFWQDAEDLVEVEQQQGQPGARGGDSGGSVYLKVGGGVQAAGTVTRAAGPRMGFQDFATANADFGVRIP
ncbi:S1 family peptidase [Amycolatopsis sp. YIM 10]|uniref:S1 family peptidase n=1 Tax=Amycolatopsis sp. YIM 10 TaxID=2653857 RepID=UPI0012AA18D2|nr:S1 family peptidase [Amycolatopsis sp. YIM 10]QFU93001.1 hypothetical protein YIM_39245 [Amycolatopsis sp. YIM 10]